MAELIVGAVVLIFLVIMFARTVRVVPQAKAGIVERFGRYQRTLNPGLTVLMPSRLEVNMQGLAPATERLPLLSVSTPGCVVKVVMALVEPLARE